MDSKLISAPSNIALIKYMGKIQTEGNQPTNSSLSYTLNELRTFVEITPRTDSDSWSALEGSQYYPFEMGFKGLQKYLKHFRFLKDQWGIKENFWIRSANNFPADSGIASSASSFAALTLASSEVFQKINPKPWGEDPEVLAQLSQSGSGSSCRSFFSPWALWDKNGAHAIDLPPEKLHHLVIVSESRTKKVSSSEAHLRVAKSSLFPGRVERAHIRLDDLIESLLMNEWKRAFEITWDEFIDMHELFAHCPEPFDYRTAHSEQILTEMKNLWKSHGDGPIVTMDAGSSVHLLFREDQLSLAQSLKKQYQLNAQVWGSI